MAGAAPGAVLGAGVAAGAGLTASRCVTLLDCCPMDLPPPKRFAASACRLVKAKAMTKNRGPQLFHVLISIDF
jgi:hypothetical protein